MILDNDILLALIVCCEVGFWVALFSGLAFRYVLHWKRVSWICLVCVPLIDIALLALTVLDLRSGSVATLVHGLAAAYVAFTVTFGSMMIGWADQRFAHWFAGGPAPTKPPSRGWASVRYELKLWARCILAVCIIYFLIFAITAFVGHPGQTRALQAWYGIPLGTVFFWFVFGPLWSLVFFKRESAAT
ncbi:MAG: hypothetical protein ABI411_11760 [Tahibacter sp.]